MWHQTHTEARSIEQVMAEAQAAQETVVQEEPAAAPPAPLPSPPPPEESFEDILKRTAAAVAPAPKIPEAVMPAPVVKMSAPAVYKSVGMGTAQFAVLTFLFCCFLTLIAAFLGKTAVVRAWPPSALLYRTLGFHVPAPGEGLRLGALAAENRVDKAGRILAVTGELVNMTEQPAPHPALRVTLSSTYSSAEAGGIWITRTRSRLRREKPCL